jgi:muconolactone delta-isomerase
MQSLTTSASTTSSHVARHERPIDAKSVHPQTVNQAGVVEFLVTMTTHVPKGTTQDAVSEVRQREAAHSHDLAERGNLHRLWRPPLNPGEWRTLGLFSAEDTDELERVLASMPLRIWRTDEVLPLSPHPNDPALSGPGHGHEFLIAMTIAIPDGTPSSAADDRFNREAQRARELSSQGHLRRLWALPAGGDVRRTLGLWNARDANELDSILESLPLYAWMTVMTTDLSPHPSDPATAN